MYVCVKKNKEKYTKNIDEYNNNICQRKVRSSKAGWPHKCEFIKTQYKAENGERKHKK